MNNASDRKCLTKNIELNTDNDNISKNKSKLSRKIRISLRKSVPLTKQTSELFVWKCPSIILTEDNVNLTEKTTNDLKDNNVNSNNNISNQTNQFKDGKAKQQLNKLFEKESTEDKEELLKIKSQSLSKKAFRLSSKSDNFCNESKKKTYCLSSKSNLCQNNCNTLNLTEIKRTHNLLKNNISLLYTKSKSETTQMGYSMTTDMCGDRVIKFPQTTTSFQPPYNFSTKSKSVSFQDLISSVSLIPYAFRSLSPKRLMASSSSTLGFATTFSDLKDQRLLKVFSLGDNISDSMSNLTTKNSCEAYKASNLSVEELNYVKPITLRKSISNYLIGRKFI